MKMTTIRDLIASSGVLSGLMLATACAYYVPTVRNDTPARFVLVGSSKHSFLDRVAYIDDDAEQLVVYGKVAHHHDACRSEGHVRLVVMEPTGRTWAEQSIPLVNRGGRRGWPGADFRIRIDGIPPKDSQLQVSFHDMECSKDGSFDCGDAESAGAPVVAARSGGRS